MAHLRIHAHGWTARQNDLDQAGSLGGSGDDRSAQAMRYAQDIDAGETCRFIRSSTQQLMAPGIQQSRADLVSRPLIGFSIPLRARARAETDRMMLSNRDRRDENRAAGVAAPLV